MAGLQTIHLHNSFIRGVRSRFDCDGHTALFGNNGAGKTTILNLIPIFVGFEPSRLMVRAASKKSFADWYLPDIQSMIVFEYTRTTGETCCAIFFRRDSNTDSKHSVRFVSGTAAETIFHPALKDSLDSDVSANIIIKEHLSSKLGITCSRIVSSMTDYRQIIQNDLKMGGASEIRAIAKQFSLIHDKRMQHIERLVAVSLYGKNRISGLQTMMVDSMLKPIIGYASAQSHEKNIHIWSDTRSLKAFQLQEVKIADSLAEYSAIQNNRTDLITKRREVAKLQQLGAAETLKLHKQIKQLNTDATDKQENYQVSYLGMIAEETKYNTEAKQIESQIHTLHAQREEFENEKNMPHWSSELERLPSYKSEMTTAQDWLRLCEADNEQKTKLADELKRQAEEVRDGEIEEIDKAKALQESSLDSAMQEFKVKINQLRKDQEIELNNAVARHDANTQERDSEIRLANAKLAMQGDLTPDEEARKAHAEEKKNASSREFESARKAEKAAQESLNTAERACNQAELNYNQCNAALARAESDRDEIYALLTPTDGSLLAFLRNSGSEWEQSLGKVINPELLKRKDLQPKTTGTVGAGASLFGIEIDLSQLDLPEQAESKEALTERAQKADKLISVKKDERDSLETKWKAAQKVKSALESDCVMAEQAVTKHIKLTHEAEGELKAITDAINRAIRQRKEECSKLVHELEKQKGIATANEKQEIIELDTKHKGALKAEEALNDEKNKEQKAQIEKLEIARNLAKQTAKEKIRSYNEALSRELSEQGYDEKTINQKRTYIAELATTINGITSRESSINAYKQWLNTDWPNRIKLAQLQSEKEADARKIREAITAAKTTHTEEMAAIKERIITITKAEAALQNKYEQWVGAERTATEMIGKIPLPNTAPAIEDQDRNVTLDIEHTITNSINELSAKTGQLINSVITVLNDAIYAITQSPDSTLYGKWQTLTQARRSVTQSALGSTQFQLEQMDDLKKTVEQDIPEIRKVLSESIKSAARLMSQHYSSLCEINKKVGSISRRLETSLNTDHDFTELTDIKVRLVSKVEELEYWTMLKAFISEWNEWYLTHNQELPTERLLKGFENLNELFNKARLVENDLSSLVDLEISMTENGRPVSIRTDHDLENVSSTGLSAIAIFIIFAALTRHLCPDETVNIAWPIDELGKIDSSNVPKLLEMLDKKNITMISAQPENANPALKDMYKHAHNLIKGEGIQKFITVELDEIEPWDASFIFEKKTTTQEVTIHE